ncbi:hypothetical protein [Helicobacter sp. T3_23-1056]
MTRHPPPSPLRKGGGTRRARIHNGVENPAIVRICIAVIASGFVKIRVAIYFAYIVVWIATLTAFARNDDGFFVGLPRRASTARNDGL